MALIFADIRAAISEAEATLRRADATAEEIAQLLVGRLRRIHNGRVLKLLKQELRNFDAVGYYGRGWKD